MLEEVLNLSSINEVFIRRESESDQVLVSFVSDELSEPLTYAFPDRHSAIVFFRFAWDLMGEFLDRSRDFRSG